MEGKYYTSERNIQILINLLKAYGIKKVIASPGTTNLTFVASIQQDPYFEVYSSVDERSAAYMACGLSSESGEPVVLSCTGATASRNYSPGLTEAFYSKIPVLAVTATQNIARIGQHVAQVIDRTSQYKDLVVMSQQVRAIKDKNDEWECVYKINLALSALKHRGGGPVHINIETTYSKDYSIKEIAPVKVLRRITAFDEFPSLPKGKIAVLLGKHKQMTSEEEFAIDNFCACYDSVVFCDHSSGYNGNYAVHHPISLTQSLAMPPEIANFDTIIQIGEITGDATVAGLQYNSVWRVSPDGLMRDTYKKLSYVFEMPESFFFGHYTPSEFESHDHLYKSWLAELVDVRSRIPELPFSNIWIAQHTAHLIPEKSVLHLAILNSLRSWNFFEFNKTVHTACNTGGFGIDGIVSTLIGASLANPKQLHFAVVGDLAFFYDMNVIGNRHVGNNVRILLINNGKGTEFTNYTHPGAAFGEEADLYIAAGGHFGQKSKMLVKHYAEDLGYEYLTASTKEEYLEKLERFITPDLTEKPMIYEVFTDGKDESDALKTINTIKVDASGKLKDLAKGILGDKGLNILNKIRK